MKRKSNDSTESPTESVEIEGNEVELAETEPAAPITEPVEVEPVEMTRPLEYIIHDDGPALIDDEGCIPTRNLSAEEAQRYWPRIAHIQKATGRQFYRFIQPKPAETADIATFVEPVSAKA